MKGVRDFFGGWRGLARFWMLAGAVTLATVGVLQLLGPVPKPEPRPLAAPAPAPAPPRAAPATPVQPVRERDATPPPDRPGRDAAGSVADPDPALLEPSPLSPAEMLPRVSADGRMPMQVYAAGFDRTTRRARVGLIVAGLGMTEADTLAAARALPAAVTFAINPYAQNLGRMLDAIRARGHEFLVSIPMEPVEFPLRDPGPRALMTTLSPEANRERLFWALSRMQGYVGATNALAGMLGERFSAMSDQMEAVQQELVRRGLVFVDARGNAPPVRYGWGRNVDMIIDDQPGSDATDARLEALSKLALDRGSALGLVTLPRPVTIDRIEAWSNTLVQKGLVLAPVTGIAIQSSGKDETK